MPAISIPFFPLPFSLGILLLLVALVRLGRRRYGFVYLFVLAIFWVYALMVIGMTLFPIVIDNEVRLPLRINLVPFYIGQPTRFTYMRVLETVANLLMTVPFGLLLPLLRPICPRRFPLVALGLGFGLELAQLLIALLTGNGSFRVTDINDVLLNGLGAMLGYGLFRLIFRRSIQRQRG